MITCVDAVSYLSETLRRILSKILLQKDENKPVNEKLKIIRPFFIDHLNTLESMSRPVDDWIYDNILQPFFGEPLSISEAVDSLRDNFDVYASSPHFMTDWRWYKELYGEKQLFNEMAETLYRKNVHNLMDYRYLFDPIDNDTGSQIIHLCMQIFKLDDKMQNFGVQNEYLKLLFDSLNRLSFIGSKQKLKTVDSIVEFINSLDKVISGGRFPVDSLIQFSSWFGRRQQYLSFIKKSVRSEKMGLS